MAELPIDLRKLETLTGALEMIHYLSTVPDAGVEDFMDDLGLSERSVMKAIRRLATNGYVQMTGDYIYTLTPKGAESAQVLAEHFSGSAEDAPDNGKVMRQLVIALPRNLVVGETSPLHIGFAPSDEFTGATDVVLRLSPTYADIGGFDEMVQLGSDALVVETEITPQDRDQARIKLEVYELSADGDNLDVAGGMYVDVVVLPEGDTGELIAYGVDLGFKAR